MDREYVKTVLRKCLVCSHIEEKGVVPRLLNIFGWKICMMKMAVYAFGRKADYGLL